MAEEFISAVVIELKTYFVKSCFHKEALNAIYRAKWKKQKTPNK
jgi:hypothetical protein